jgi:glycosyltransferase involved in cell wall biosynthesis
MYKGLSIAAVVPAHNEEDLIVKTVGSMPPLVDRVIVVDDASTDATVEQALATADPRLELVRHERNTGVGGAIISGHRRAIELQTDVAVVMAGDAQMDPAYLPDLLDPIADEGYAFTKADRFFGFDSFAGMPRHRIVGNVVVGFLAKASTGYWNLFDPLNGYTATRTDTLARLPLERIRTDYAFECDILVYLNTIRARAMDVPIPAVYGDERSGIRLFRDAGKLLWSLFRGFWRRIVWKYVLWSFSPVAIFLFVGLALVAWAVGFGAWVVYETVGDPVASTATVLMSVGPLLVGINLLIVATVLDILETPR